MSGAPPELPGAAYAVLEGTSYKLPWKGCAHASACYRKTIEKLGTGSRDTPGLTVYNSVGQQVGHVSYNGRVWASTAEETWRDNSTREPVYCPTRDKPQEPASEVD